jgi:hypothetical protein
MARANCVRASRGFQVLRRRWPASRRIPIIRFTRHFPDRAGSMARMLRLGAQDNGQKALQGHGRVVVAGPRHGDGIGAYGLQAVLLVLPNTCTLPTSWSYWSSKSATVPTTTGRPSERAVSISHFCFRAQRSAVPWCRRWWTEVRHRHVEPVPASARLASSGCHSFCHTPGVTERDVGAFQRDVRCDCLWQRP